MRMNDPQFQPTAHPLERLRSGKDQRAWHDFEDTYKGFIFSLIVRMGMTQKIKRISVSLC